MVIGKVGYYSSQLNDWAKSFKYYKRAIEKYPLKHKVICKLIKRIYIFIKVDDSK